MTEEKPPIESTTMSLAKAAAYLGIGRNAIYTHVKAGRIEVVSFPGRTFKLVTRAALDKFRDSCTGTIGSASNQDEAEVRTPTKSERNAALDDVFARKPRVRTEQVEL